jgi:CRISPR-associated endonuclease/helicase Cas3
MNLPLAHSPRPPYGPQSYGEHSRNVGREARGNAERAAAYYGGDRAKFVEDVAAAAVYHDLGKLDAKNQDVLRRVSRQPLPLAHEDAGVAHLLDCKLSEAAVLVAAHHAGLFDESDERKKPTPFRNLNVAVDVDHHLADYLKLHKDAGCSVFGRVARSSLLHRTGWERRLALSCLVDADHGDTARHRGNEPEPHWPDPRWADRLRALDEYVAKLPRGSPRDADRTRVYEACGAAPVNPGMRACDAPVGSGKTTAVMTHLLRVAAAGRLRHIFVVLPYVNIVRQSVQTYRKAILLPGEDALAVVAEHDHQADFDSLDARQLATLWRAPIIVTTAVQFFETIGAHHPARLRKLHELPGSAVFVDEAHAVLHAHLWPQMWLWLEEWVSNWGGHIVLASGSLPRFWELREFVDPPKKTSDVPDLVPEIPRGELAAAEGSRVALRTNHTALTLDELVEFIMSKPGPRIIVLNTVQSAAVVADRIRRVHQGGVLHLSTALTPTDRLRMLDRVRAALAATADLTLVATSCVEAGLDLSFRTGFRETATTASIIQVGGRVNRQAKDDAAEVWDFHVDDPLLPNNPQLEVAQRVVTRLFADGSVGSFPASKLALEGMRLEITEGQNQRAQELRETESAQRYPEVARLCRVIDADSRFVIIERDLAQALRDDRHLPAHKLLKGSVQIWARKLAKLPAELIRGTASDPHSIYVWTGDYDPDFLGYMVGQLAQTESYYIA